MNKRFVLSACLFFILGVSVMFLINRNISKNIPQLPAVATSNNLSNIEYLVNKDEIVFLYKHINSDSRIAGVVKIADHPKLKEKLGNFSSGDNITYLQVIPIKLSDGKDAAVIINSFPDHGDFGSNYAMVYRLLDDKVLYETGGLFEKGRFKGIAVSENGDIKLDFVFGYYDACNTCGFLLNEFLVYDKQTGLYVTKNASQKSVFEKTLKSIEQQKCSVDLNTKQELTFPEIKAKYGENYECRFDNQARSWEDKLTPKIYFVIKQTLEDIINDKEISISNLNL